MSRITVVKSSRVPCGFLVCLVTHENGYPEWDEADDASTVCIQSEGDIVSVAQEWGFIGDDIADARTYLEDECLGTIRQDPGYFC